MSPYAVGKLLVAGYLCHPNRMPGARPIAVVPPQGRRGRARAGRVPALCCALVLAWLAGPATPTAAGRNEVDLRPPLGMGSRSVDYVFEGRLRRGMRIAASQYVHHVAEYRAHGYFYGTWQLVQLIERAARRVAFRLPGARLSVGELSAPAGGAIPGHRSHQSGRDADLGFYARDALGNSVETTSFGEFDVRGVGRGRAAGLRFDDARNWELVAKLVADTDARVQYVFVENGLRQRLLAYAAAIGAPSVLRERAATVMLQPSHGHPHANHFHVRIYCAPEDRPTCRDQAPYWAWYPGRVPGGLFAALGRTRHVYE